MYIRSLGSLLFAFFLCAALSVRCEAAQGVFVVALGASQTYGKGVSRSEAFPAQLEALLRVQGYNARVINAGVNGDTTRGMLARLDRAVPRGANVVILQPGGNDWRQGLQDERAGNIAEIENRLRTRGVKVVMLENGTWRGLPRQADGQHLTSEGYRTLAQWLLPEVISAIGR
jgi:acyl-CoA thioesterase I